MACHSVQGCVKGPTDARLDEQYPVEDTRWEIAGINHQAWLLKVEHKGEDLYPIIKQTAKERIARLRSRGAPGKWMRELATKIGIPEDEACYNIGGRARTAYEDGLISVEEAEDASVAGDLVRLEMMFTFGYYVTESSEHCSEYHPWFLKKDRLDLVDHYNIPLDEYPRRCRNQTTKQREELWPIRTRYGTQTSHEFGAYIMDSIQRDNPIRIAGNVLNTCLIINRRTAPALRSRV